LVKTSHDFVFDQRFNNASWRGHGLEHQQCLGLGLEEKVLQFLKTFVVILDGSEQGIL